MYIHIFKLKFNEKFLFMCTFSVSKPAPDWDATAVIDGQFKRLKLSDFKGSYVVFFFYPLDL